MSDHTQSWRERTWNCCFRVVRPCVSWLPCFLKQHQVHPASDDPPNSHYMYLDHHRKVRVIHIERNTTSFPANVKRLSTIRVVKGTSSNRNSLHLDVVDGNARWKRSSILSNGSDVSIEEYWFTRWSRPLNLPGPCNCSFKKCRDKNIENNGPKKVFEESTRRIIGSTVQTENNENKRSVDKNHQNTHSSVECFVDCFLQKIFFDVFIHIKQSKNLSEKSNSVTERKILQQTVEVNNIDTVDGYVNPSFLGSPCNPDIFHCSTVPDSIKVEAVNDNVSHCESQNILGNSKSDIVLETKESLADNQKHSKTSRSSSRKSCKQILKNCKENNDLNVENVEKRVSWPAPCCQSVHMPRSKPVLYFLHGVGSSADLWAALVQYFTCAGYEVVAPDMLGHGYSTAPDDLEAYTFENLLRDALDVFDKFIGDRRAIVIGHAFGSSLAAALARYRCQQVVMLVLISGGGPTPLAPKTADVHSSSSFCSCISTLLNCGMRRNVLYAPRGKHMEPSDVFSDGVPQYVLDHIAQGQDWPEGDATFHRRILVPTLLVHGLQDPLITLVQECEMERTIPRSFLEVIPNAGHLPMVETPSELSHMIHCFIEWWIH